MIRQRGRGGRGNVGGRESEGIRRGGRGRSRGTPDFAMVETAGASSLKKIFQQARASGNLNLTSRGLDHVPPEVFNLADGVDAAEGEKFWEVCDLERLDLSFNQISDLPPQVSNLGLLASLKMRNNSLSYVPAELFTLETLSLLDLSGNTLEELPEALEGAISLKSLLLAGNRLRALPDSLGSLSALDALHIDNNAIQALPETIGSLRRLSKLTAAGNGLRSFPDALGGLVLMSLLDLSNNAIERMPAGLAGLTRLSLLDMRENKLITFPPLPQGSSLSQVFLGFNVLDSVNGSALLGVSGGLTELHLQSNRISSLPDEIGSLSKLKTLDVSNNNLGDLPPAIGYLPNLHRLAVEGNSFRTVRRSLISGGVFALKKYLRTRGPCPPYPGLEEEDKDEAEPHSFDGNSAQTVLRAAMESGTLDLEGRGLQTLDGSLFEDQRAAEAVKRTKLSRNKLLSLPAGLRCFTNLAVLEAGENLLTDLSPELGCMQLSRLSLRRNKLSSIALNRCLGGDYHGNAGVLSQSLLDLDLSSNGLDKVPEAIFACSRLQTLVLAYNSLSEISGLPWMSLSALETLDLSANQLRVLGDVTGMTWLRRLNLENNEILVVPPELGLCTSLETLLLAGNPQRQLGAALLERGTTATLQYLRDRLPPGHRPRTLVIPTALPSQPRSEDCGKATAVAMSTSTEVTGQFDGWDKRAPTLSNFSAPEVVDVTVDEVKGKGEETQALLSSLRAEAEALEMAASAPGLSQAKAYALKKELRMKRAALIREERILQQGGRGGSNR